MSESTVVKAIYPFKGKNNDELNFKKGDVITITQKIDGGWWEGTLGEITGWFPSNYVCEIKDPNVVPYVHHDSTNLAIVYKDLVDSEKAHIDELQGLATNFLKPLERSTILTTDEFKQLCCNFQEVLETHQTLLKLVEDELQKPHKEQRIGRQFLHHATHMKNVHQAYCSLHPKAACIIDKYRDELTKYMESCGANSPGVLVLTTGLSKPFRRLAKYSGMLLEVERHVEGSHPDRGDIQRSVAVYKDIDMTCAATRRHKELELQVLTGPVRGWEGQSLSTLGDIIYMGSVAVGSQHLDRYFVLFASNLLILSVSHRLSAFIYEGKLPAAGMVVTRLEDSDQYKNAFEISCPMTDKVLAVCQSREEANHWVDLLRSYNSNRTTLSNSKVQSQAEIYPQPPPHLNQRGYCTRMSVLNYTLQCNYEPTFPCEFYPPAAPYAGLTKFYQQQVKKRSINKSLLKTLLYPEYRNSVDLSMVKRRQHISECFFKCTSIINCDSDSDSDSSSSSSDDDNDEENKDKVKRQNAFDSDGDDESNTSSNPFGYIRYYNPQSGSRIETEYESFIDHFQTKTKKVVDLRESKKPSVIMTSSATLELGVDGAKPRKSSSIHLVPQNRLLLAQNVSQESDASSYVTPNCALENLSKLNGSFEVDTHIAGSTLMPIARQSCPNKLVADKFNKSSLTTLYVSPCQSNSDDNLAWKYKDPSSASTTTHSSSIDLPAPPVPIPDSMLAELLYNTDNFSVINPPTMFSEDLRNQSLTLSNIGFSNHSLNSDKQYKRRSSIQMSTDLLEDGYKMLRDSLHDDCCRFCTQSPRSSDSGMAGSCNLNSPDCRKKLGERNIVSLAGSETFESQCRCTSPFGSTPRTSANAVIGSSTRSSVTSAELPPVPSPYQSIQQIHSKITDIRNSSQQQHQLLQQSRPLSHSKSTGAIRQKIIVAEDGKAEIYRSGLYAHWWLKTKIPIEVVRGIYEEANNSTKPDVHVSRATKHQHPK